MPIFNLVPCSQCGKKHNYMFDPAMTFAASFWICQGCGHKISIMEMDRKMTIERMAASKRGEFKSVAKHQGNLVDDGFVTYVPSDPILDIDEDDSRDLNDLFNLDLQP